MGLGISGVDVDLEVRGVGAHRHARRHAVHLDAGEVGRRELHAVAHDGLADAELAGLGGRNEAGPDDAEHRG
jgi:hypothetical protein